MPEPVARAVVTVAIGRTYGLYRVAEALAARGALVRLHTTYPRFSLARFILPRSVVTSYWPLEATARAAGRLPLVGRRPEIDRWRKAGFDRLAARGLRDANVVFGQASACLHTLRAARRRGAVSVVHRSSTHVTFQRDLLHAEFRAHGLAGDPVDPWAHDRGLAEYAEADYILVPSRFAARSFAPYGVPQSKLVVVPEGVDPTQFTLLRERTFNPRRFVVLVLGRVGLRKGVPYVLRAARALDLPGLEIRLVGALEPEGAALLAGRPDHVTYRGVVPSGSVAAELAQADALLHPAIEDGFGHSVVEALAAGLPVIVSEHTGASELIAHGHHGFVIPIRDAAAIQASVETLYRNRELARHLGQAGRRRAAAASWSAIGTRIAACADRLVADA